MRNGSRGKAGGFRGIAYKGRESERSIQVAFRPIRMPEIVGGAAPGWGRSPFGNLELPRSVTHCVHRHVEKESQAND